jgi:plastocyanin
LPLDDPARSLVRIASSLRIVGPARIALGALAAALIALGGCGDDEKSATTETATEQATGPSGQPVATVEVSATDFKFTPANPGVQKTGVVAFELTNDGQATHALEVEGPDGEVETKPLQPGESETIKADLNRPGRYTWYCPIGDHRERGMDGFVLVAGGGSGGGGSGTGTDDSSTSGETETEQEGADDNSGSGGGNSGSGGSKPEDDSKPDDSGGTPSPY